jgi:biotin transport system substrate-specific component
MAEVGFEQQTAASLGASSPIGQSTAAPGLDWRTGATVVLATALVGLCAHIAVPLGFTPVPVTMQTFAVLLLGLLMSPGAAFACLTLYLAEGALGLPMFSPQGPGGLAQLLGPTGGYLLSYPFAACLAAVLYRRGARSFLTALGSAALGSLLILLCGAAWLGVVTHAPLGPLFSQSIAPFLPGDAVKLLAAAGSAGLLGSFSRGKRTSSI